MWNNASENAAKSKVSEAAMCALCTQQAAFSLFEAVLSYCDSFGKPFGVDGRSQEDRHCIQC